MGRSNYLVGVDVASESFTSTVLSSPTHVVMVTETPNSPEGFGEFVSQLESDFNASFDTLTRLCQAMWSLIEENTDLTEKDLESRILELEILEGKLLEEVEDTVECCPSCNAAIPAGMDKCQFCSHEL